MPRNWRITREIEIFYCLNLNSLPEKSRYDTATKRPDETFIQLYSLEQRRLHFDLLMCCRIIFGLVNVCASDFFELHCASQTRGHPFKLYKERSYSSVRASYFSVRVINVWNSLPADRVDFSSFAAFKQTIEQIDFS